ncbi:dTDP-4-amino-4,6-dideoxygalactose transaminase [Pustulibacterium marinum]|uniref:dTDP-4-amino-4,6-dideoxygalactose transaminase n=1 Tax=Pustulibacterium marinum TaxID=1224947 RepID=A0A1I7ETT9_9FLAO|nr:dTDP-4-amino-4,6-dideoxygalactose transaminase [Pustulibacterium marinum]
MLSPPCVNHLEEQYVQNAIKSGWIAPQGPEVIKFENAIQHYLGEEVFPVAVNSGTAAIHLSLLALGAGKVDFVITQSFTFTASANPIQYVGATPIFIDSEDETWNMSPILLQKSIEDLQTQNKKPKAIIAVSLYGMPFSEEIKVIANQYNIPLIEDSAEALGSSFKNRKCGTFGDLAIFSFNGNKIITTSGGGAVICKTKEQADYIRFLANQAKDDAPFYQHSQLGFNYALSNISAAIGNAQITKLPEFVIRRKTIQQHYKDALAKYDFIKVHTEPTSDFSSNHWLTCILIDENEAGKTNTELKDYLASKGIESRFLWKPMHLQPLYAKAKFYGDGTSETLFSKGLCLPSGSGLTDEQLSYIIETIHEFFAA